MKPKKITRLGEAGFIRYALCAGSGFGKTVQAGTADRALFLTTDPEGTMSAKRFGSTAEEWKIESWNELDEAFVWLRDEGIKAEGYRWLIIDNGTECQNFAMQMSIENRMKRYPNGERLVPEQRDYQIAQNGIVSFVKAVHTLPINVLWTFHIKGMEDGEGEPFYSVAVQGQQGQTAQQVLGYMNITGMGEVIEKEREGKPVEVRRTWFTHHGPWRGKDRYCALGRFKDGLTIPRLEELIDASKEGDKPARKKRTTTTATRRKTVAR